MVKNYNQLFYPNPFRYRKSTIIENEDQIFEEVWKTFEPFLVDKVSEIHEYFNELGNLKSEFYIARTIRNSIKDNYDLLLEKIEEKIEANFITRRLAKYIQKYLFKYIQEYIEELQSLENYQNNLRYLDIPVQPLVDNEGFTVQLTSNQLVKSTLSDIEEGISYIYDYCSDALPEPITLWEDYALQYQDDFPNVAHDYLLELTYYKFDSIFKKLQNDAINGANLFKDFKEIKKIQNNLINGYNVFVSGDFNTRVLTIVKPKFYLQELLYVFRLIIESLISLLILILIAKFIINKLKPILLIQQKKLLQINPKRILRKAKTKLNFKKFRIQQKMRQLKLNLNALSLRLNFKYRVLQWILNKSIV